MEHFWKQYGNRTRPMPRYMFEGQRMTYTPCKMLHKVTSIHYMKTHCFGSKKAIAIAYTHWRSKDPDALKCYQSNNICIENTDICEQKP